VCTSAMFSAALPVLVHCLPARAPSPRVPEVPSCLLTITKTDARFSAITIDQDHEQNNAMVQGEGSALGLMENPSALRRWMLSGPEMARLVNEFDASAAPETNPESRFHHEAKKGFHAAFHRDGKSLVQVFEDLGNPFDRPRH